MELFQHNPLTTPSNSGHSGLWMLGDWNVGVFPSASASPSNSSRNKEGNNHIATCLAPFYRSHTLNLQLLSFQIYSHVQTSPRLGGRAPASLVEVVLPRSSFWVLMSLKSRGQILGSTVPLLCSILALQRGCKSDPKSQLNLFSGTGGGRIIKTRQFPLEKWASFCSRDEWAAMKFYNSHNKPVIKIVTKKTPKPNPTKNWKSFKLPVVSW